MFYLNKFLLFGILMKKFLIGFLVSFFNFSCNVCIVDDGGCVVICFI